MILFIIVCIGIGIILAFLLAPILMMANRKNLKEMDKLIAEFDALPSIQKEAARESLKRKLVEIKTKISSVDKAAVEQARDKISMI